MSYFIFIMFYVLMILVIKYENRVNPSSIFCAFYCFLFGGAVTINGLVDFVIPGQIYMQACIIIFWIGSWVSKHCSIKTGKREKNLVCLNHTFRVERARLLVNISLLTGAISALERIIQYGFSLKSLMNMYQYSISAYVEMQGMHYIFKILLVVFLSGFTLDGFFLFYSKVKNVSYKSKFIWLALMMIAYSLIIAKKSFMVVGVILWASGCLGSITTYYDGYRERFAHLKRELIKVIPFFLIAVGALLFMTSIRSNLRFSETIAVFNVYLFDELYVFGSWFDGLSGESLLHSHGRTLLYGIFDQFDLAKDLYGNWPLNAKATSIGIRSNIYTVFWAVIQDFSFFGSYLFWLIMGLVTGIIEKRIIKTGGRIFSCTVLVSIYLFILYSFTESFAHTLIVPLSLVVFAACLFACYLKQAHWRM